MINTKTLFFRISIILAASLLFACAGPPEPKAINPDLFEYKTYTGLHGHTLHVAHSGKPDKTPVVMIHGTPGSWDSYSDLMQDPTMQNNYAMYAIDRLGWGKSESANKTIEAQFKPHTDSINTLLESIYKETGKQSIIIGHSLGASLVPMVAIASPQYVKGLLIIAGDIDPKFGDPRWYNSLADLWLVKKLLPTGLVKANDEIMPLKQELLTMNKRLSDISVPVAIIHGTKDKLVSYENVAYAEQAFSHLQDKLYITSIENAGHFVIWEHIPTIIESIHTLDKLQ